MKLYIFEDWRLDSKTYSLARKGLTTPLTPTLFSLLVTFLESDGQVLTKEKLMGTVWGGRSVEEGNINRQISTLRRLLGDTPKSEQYIQTLSRVGYRFAARVSVVAQNDLHQNHPTSTHGRFVNRFQEQRALHEALRAAESGQGSLVCVTGDAGLGKTTLIKQFLQALPGPSEYFVARAQAPERFGETAMYLPLLDALEDLIRGNPEELQEEAASVAPSWSSAIFSGRRSSKKFRTGPQQMKRELAAFLRSVARKRTVVFFIDDWHWTDASTVDALTYLVTTLGDLPILWITAYRPNELVLTNSPFRIAKLDLQSRRVCWEIPLRGLDPAQIAQFVSLQFPEHRFPGEFARFLERHTEGHPLFLAELLRYLHEKQFITADRNGWVVAPEALRSNGLPETVKAMVQRKIHHLSDADRTILATASAQGSEFDSALVAAASGIHPVLVEERLQTAESAFGLVRLLGESPLPDGTPSVRCAFTHVLYQNALFDALTPARRATVCGAMAENLMLRGVAETQGLAQHMGFLFEQSQDYAKASQYLARAAREAASSGGCREAAQLGERALELLRRGSESERDDRESDLLLEVARYWWDLRTTEGLQRTIRYCSKLIQASPAIGPAYTMLASAYAVLSSYGFVPARAVIPKAQSSVEKALELQPQQAETHTVRGFLRFMYDWDVDGAEESFKTAMQLDGPCATTYHWYSLCLAAIGRFDDAVAAITRSSQLDPSSMIIRTQLGWILYFARRFDDAMVHLRETRDLDPGFWRSHLNIAFCRIRTGPYDEAVAAMERAVALNENTTTLSLLAQAHAVAGNAQKARAILQRLSEGSQYVSPYYLALIHIGLGDHDRALDCLEDAYLERQWLLVLIRVEPALDPLRHRSRFKQLVRKVGIRSAD